MNWSNVSPSSSPGRSSSRHWKSSMTLISITGISFFSVREDWVFSSPLEQSSSSDKETEKESFIFRDDPIQRPEVFFLLFFPIRIIECTIIFLKEPDRIDRN